MRQRRPAGYASKVAINELRHNIWSVYQPQVTDPQNSQRGPSSLKADPLAPWVVGVRPGRPGMGEPGPEITSSRLSIGVRCEYLAEG